MKTKHKLLSSILVLFSLCSFASCAPDMGTNFKTDEDYGNGYDINFYKSDRKKLYDETVKITDFYNNDSVNDFDCVIDYDEYRYLIIHPSNDCAIDELYFYVNSSKDGALRYKLFVTNNLPSKFSNLDDALSSFNEYLQKSEAEKEAGFTFDYGDEPSKNALASGSKSLTANKWTDIGLTSFYKDGLKLPAFSVSSSQYILIQFYNNVDTEITFKKGMTLEDAKKAIQDRRANRMSIKLTNIMIHSV